MSSAIATDILKTLDGLAGGVHTGFRPVHARGTMFSGLFTPSPKAAKLTRAPHALTPSTAVTVRFSLSSGLPNMAENDPQGSSPQGIAVRFHLADHVHTDVIAHSINGFPTRTGEEFLEFLKAAAASGQGVPAPQPIASFLDRHPVARVFIEAPRLIPKSYAQQQYFAVTAFKFTNASDQSRFGRFRFRPEAGTDYFTPGQAAEKTTDFLAGELSVRLARGPVRFRLLVQLAEEGDAVADSTVIWPESRTLVEFGMISISQRVDELAPEQRKIIFDPLPRVDGIDSAGDPLTELRSDIYLQSGRRRRAAVE